MLHWKNPLGFLKTSPKQKAPPPTFGSTPESPTVTPESHAAQPQPVPPANPVATEQPIKQPVSSPVASKKKATKPKIQAASILETFPKDLNLVGKSRQTFPIDNQNHTLEFRDSGILLDGIKYIVSAHVSLPFGGDAPLTIFDATVRGKELQVIAGIGNQKGILKLDDKDIRESVLKLLKGETVEQHAGTQTVQIARQMY